MAYSTVSLRRFALVCLLIVVCKSPTCAGKLGLRVNLKRMMGNLAALSRLMAPLTVKAINYTNNDYSISIISCNPTCISPAHAVMRAMNLTRSNWDNTSKSALMEFHNRVFLTHSQQVKASLAGLARLRNKKTAHPAYLGDFLYTMNTIETLIPKAIKLLKKIKSVSPPNGTAGQQSTFVARRNATSTSSTSPQSITSLACHFSGCVLENLLIECREMLVDFLKIKNSL